MYELKKIVIFDIEQSYFLLNKIDFKFANSLLALVSINLFYFNQQNLFRFSYLE
jgi:hypothetical protein